MWEMKDGWKNRNDLANIHSFYALYGMKTKHLWSFLELVHLLKFYRILIWVLQCPSQSFYKIHGHLGVSSLTWYENYLYSTGRDGTLRCYLMLEGESRLECLNADKLQIDWPAATSLSAFGLLVLGFRAVCILKYSLWRYVNKLTDLILSKEMVSNDVLLKFRVIKEQV
jgi:hypothetical protein